MTSYFDLIGSNCYYYYKGNLQLKATYNLRMCSKFLFIYRLFCIERGNSIQTQTQYTNTKTQIYNLFMNEKLFQITILIGSLHVRQFISLTILFNNLMRESLVLASAMDVSLLSF